MTTFANDLLKQITPPTSTIPALGKGITLDDLPGDDGSDQPSVPDSRTPTGKSLDDFIAQNRLVTPAEVVNKRKVQRSTIAEMNQTDPDALRARLFSMHRDDRSPVIKVLDLIDAPRNIILSHLAPKLRVAAQERGDTGAFGLGRVNFSDVLRELGVTNRVAAGLLGFVGDVLFDPLTYVGPAGWGAELASKTAQGSAKVGLRAAGTKALKREIAKVAAGSAEIGDDVARAYLHAKGFTPERIAALAGTGLKPHEIQSRIAKATFGDPSRSIVERMFRPLGGERTFGVVDEIPEDLRGLVTTPGGLADDFMRSEGPVSDAARAFVEKYVAGGGKALRIGTGGEIGTQVAHIPFLSQYTLQVPRFTHGATINARNLALAKSAALGVSDTVGAASDPLVQLTHRIADTTAGVHQDLEARVAERAQHEELRKNLSNELPPDTSPPPTDPGGPIGPVGPQPKPIVPGMDGGLELPPTAPERTSNFIIDSVAETPQAPAEQGRIAFDVDARAQELLDQGDVLDPEEARHMAQIEADAAARQAIPPATDTAGGSISPTPSSAPGGAPETGATGAGHVLEEGRQEGREGLLSPDPTTTPPAAGAGAGGFTSHRERALGEARAAFSDRPQEELDAFAALVDARAKAMVKSGQIKTPEELWSTFSVAKGADGKSVLYQGTDTDTDAFRRWFKNSAVVDADGKPLKVFHYTRFGPKKAPFEVFVPTRQHTVYRVDGQPVQTAWRSDDLAANPDAYMSMAVTDAQTLGLEKAIKFRSEELAPYLATSESARRHLRDLERLRGKQLTATEEMLPVEAGSYFTPHLDYFGHMGEMPEGSAIYPVYLSIQNPKWVSAQEIESAGMWPEKVREYKQMGHDGVIFGVRGDLGKHPGWDGASQIVVFDSSQVKSAIGNTGAYDHTRSNILLQKRGGEPRASIRWEDGHAFIRALKSPNVSSLFHETGHLFLPTLSAAEHKAIAKAYGVDAKLLNLTSPDAAKNRNLFRRWVSVHEQWANDFERYLASGKAPTPELQSVFDKLKQWFTDLYKKIVGTPLEKDIHPEIRKVMDRMLGGVDDGVGLAVPQGKVTRSSIWKRLEGSVEDAMGMISDGESVIEDRKHDVGVAWATVWKKIPTELKMALQRPGGDSLRRQFIRVVGPEHPKSGGEDAVVSAFGGDYEKYVDWLEELAGSNKAKVLRAAEMTEKMGGNPAASFWREMWEAWPVRDRKAVVAKMDTLNVTNAGPDVEFAVHGKSLRTMLDEDGSLVVAYDTPRGERTVPAELIGEMPVDPGSVKKLSEEEIAARQGVDDTNLYQRDVAGQEGLFGSKVGRIGSGQEQGSLFGKEPAPAPSEIPVGEPERMLNESDEAYKARVAQHRKWAESARNTGTLFQGGPDPDTLPLGNLPPQAAEDARWSEREKQFASSIDEKISHLRMLTKASDDALAAFEASAAAGEVSNLNDVLRVGEMLGDAQAAVDDAIASSHLTNMMLAATKPDPTGLRLIDTGDPADLAEQLGEHLYHLAITDPDSAEQLAEAARARMEAAMNYRESLRSTLQSVADRQTGHMADLAKTMLSTDDESVALSVFGPVAKFFADRAGVDSRAYKIADSMDRFWRRTFGVRRGFVHQAIAETRGQYSKGSISERMHAAARLALKAQGLNIPGVPENEATHLLYLWTAQRLDPQRIRFFWNKLGPDGQDLGKSDLLMALDKFQGAGGFSPESQAKLNQAADEFISEMRQLGLSEQSQGILGLIRDPYLPAHSTDESQKAMFEHAAGGSQSKTGDKSGWPTQGFQRAKTTDQIRYPDPLNPNRTRRFFVGQMYLADTPDEHLDEAGLSIKRAVVDYLDMAKADPAFALAHQPRPTDALELNALYNEGTHFQHLTGGKPLEQLFDTDLATLYGKRMGDHVRAQSMQDLGRIVLAQGYQIGDMLNLDANGAKVGMTGKLRGGTDVTLAGLVPSNMGGQAHGVRIGGTLYRRLDPKIWNSMDDNVFAQMLGRLPVKMDDLVLHHAVADQIEDVVKLGSPDQLEKILRAADNITGLWKQLTLFHPSWVVGNIVGDTMNAVVGGADPRDMADPRLVRDMIRLRTSMHDPSKIKDMVVTLKTGQEIPAQELLRTFVDHRIIDNNLTAEAMVAIGKQNPGLFSALNDRALSRVVGPWFKANQHVQDVMRMTAFVSFLNQGHDAISAQRHVLRSMFDYGDFTRVEERAFRRLFPFYSWMRNNIGYQVAMLGQRPSYAALMSKLQPALEELMAGEGAVPDGQRPSWLRNALAVQVGTDPNHRFALTLGTLLPQGDLLQVLSPILGTDGALNFMHYFSSNLTPNLTVPLQLGTGTEFFSGRSIGGDNLSGDMSAGEMLRSQVRPLAEIGNISRAYQQGGLTQAIGRGVLGGRVQSFDQNRLDSSVRREFRDREERLRSAIRRAERRGDSDTSLEARARLMDLYRDALKRGLEDVVPAWAEEQLAQLAG